MLLFDTALLAVPAVYSTSDSLHLDLLPDVDAHIPLPLLHPTATMPEPHAVSPTLFTGSLSAPPSTSPLTSPPTENFSDQPWITLHQLATPSPPQAFWYVVQTFTSEQHWNRTIYSLQITEEELFHPSTTETHPIESPQQIQEDILNGFRYNAIRLLNRKTPAPIGGPTGSLCYDAQESTAQYVENDADHTLHVAVFSLCIPEQVVTPDNPRALTYWPFQYPKVRAYRFVYVQPHASDQCMLQYQVLPLGDENMLRQFETLKEHSINSAIKMLTLLNKRLAKFNPITNSSTYIKRVPHDNLISEPEFRSQYNILKQKYSFWVAQWTEVTDPQKFVFEEMSIAAYLIALWQRERAEESLSEKQSFIDMGCGNGFLVYLLISEGHPGIGVDLQKRHIWDKYPPEVTAALRHEEVDPLTFDVSAYDWVLGNHSDELSPWIPVMTARAQQSLSQRRITPPPSSLADEPQHPLRRARPRFFILPCCFFDFDGRKVSFGRTRRTLGVRVEKNTGKYEQYYRWIARIGRTFGFTTEYENLRIPSTKYVSILGRFIEFEERISEEVIHEMTTLLTLDARQSRG